MPISRETALYYDPMGGARADQLKSVLVRMGVRIRHAAKEQTGQTVGCLLGRKDFAVRESAEAPVLEEPMLVLDGFSDKRLEILLREMKRTGIQVPYKAVVTETNLGWLLSQLYEELSAEHEAMGG